MQLNDGVLLNLALSMLRQGDDDDDHVRGLKQGDDMPVKLRNQTSVFGYPLLKMIFCCEDDKKMQARNYLSGMPSAPAFRGRWVSFFFFNNLISILCALV